MRAAYRSVCVKFREDDAAQMRAWQYLQAHGAEKSYSTLIAEAIACMEQGKEVTEDCRPADCRPEGTENGKTVPDGQTQEQLRRMAQTLLDVKELCTAIRDDAGRVLPPGGGESAAAEEVRQKDEEPNPLLDFLLDMGGELTDADVDTETGIHPPSEAGTDTENADFGIHRP